MQPALWIWFGLVAVAFAVWLGRLLLVGLINRIMPPLHSGMFADENGDMPRLSVLVAAKDEEKNIEECLRSLLAQDYPDPQIIAVNDRSGDATGEIMNRMAEADPRLNVHHVQSLPDDWFGKNNAMREGLERSTGDWLFFTDADCVHASPRSLSVAMRYALQEEADFLSVLPSHEANSFWERVIQPASSAVLMLWFNPITVNNPARSTAYANGAFMMMRRSCYEAIGGHEVVRKEVNEDIHMARLAKQAGQRLKVVTNRDLYTVRMYGSFQQCWSGWSRIFAGCFVRIRKLLAVAAVLTEFSIFPWLTLGVCLAAGGTGWSSAAAWPLLQWTAAAACVLQLVVMTAFYRLSKVPFLYGLLYPFASVLVLGMLLNAVRYIAGRSTITWRGTTFRGGAIESPEDTASSEPAS